MFVSGKIRLSLRLRLIIFYRANPKSNEQREFNSMDRRKFITNTVVGAGALALTAAKTFKPLTQTQIAAILNKTKSAAITGIFEKFKTEARFDGTAKNPKWLGGMMENA